MRLMKFFHFGLCSICRGVLLNKMCWMLLSHLNGFLNRNFAWWILDWSKALCCLVNNFSFLTVTKCKNTFWYFLNSTNSTEQLLSWSYSVGFDQLCSLNQTRHESLQFLKSFSASLLAGRQKLGPFSFLWSSNQKEPSKLAITVPQMQLNYIL